jgi:protein arginine kinase
MYWTAKEQTKLSPVISTRVRFARNAEDAPFPFRLSVSERKAFWERTKEALKDWDWMAVDFGEAEPLVKEAYVQTRLASPHLAAKGEGSGLLLSRKGECSLMVNEEDHFRLQVILAGRALREALEQAWEWEKKLAAKLPLAYREGLGYLTACPTNLGAGMRISVMIHLPALTEAGQVAALAKRLGETGFTVRGLFGENSREGGCIYQISNQMSREKTPEEIVYAFEMMLTQVEEAEYRMGRTLWERDPLGMEDRISRAVGTMRYAKTMSYEEFMSLYSPVRFGKILGVEEAGEPQSLDRLLIELMPAPMQLRDRTLSEAALRDQRRSEALRESMGERRKSQ